MILFTKEPKSGISLNNNTSLGICLPQNITLILKTCYFQDTDEGKYFFWKTKYISISLTLYVSYDLWTNYDIKTLTETADMDGVNVIYFKQSI